MRKLLLTFCAGLATFLCFSQHSPAANAAEHSSTGPFSAEPAAPAQDGTMPALTAIAGQGMMNSEAFDDLEELSDYIGGRVTGSPEAAQAVEWGIRKMKAMGLVNVHAEKWQISHGWTRGTAEAEILAPIHRRLTIDAMGWVGSTKAGGEEAEIVPVNVNNLEDEMKTNSASWAGKVILIVKKGEAPKGPAAMASFAKFGDLLKKAHEVHAVAVIGGQGESVATGMHLTHTGAMGFDTYYEIPVVSMIAEDQEQLTRFVDQGKTVKLKINVQNKVSSGPVDSANVVGEIRGSEHPEQVIVVGGHHGFMGPGGRRNGRWLRSRHNAGRSQGHYAQRIQTQTDDPLCAFYRRGAGPARFAGLYQNT